MVMSSAKLRYEARLAEGGRGTEQRTVEVRPHWCRAGVPGGPARRGPPGAPARRAAGGWDLPTGGGRLLPLKPRTG